MINFLKQIFKSNDQKVKELVAQLSHINEDTLIDDIPNEYTPVLLKLMKLQIAKNSYKKKPTESLAAKQKRELEEQYSCKAGSISLKEFLQNFNN